MEKSGKHFVLVHGIGFGGWIWYKVATLLKSNGHKVTAIDLASCGIHPKSAEGVTSFSDYAQPLMDFIANLPPDERVVLVGHSFGGIVISVAVEKFPQKIVAAAFTAGPMPGPQTNMDILNQAHKKHMDSLNFDYEYVFGNGEDKPPTSFCYGPVCLSTKLLQLSPLEAKSLACLLNRPAGTSVVLGTFEKTPLTKENYGSIPRVYLITEKDIVAKEDLQRWVIQENPPSEVKIIHDSDHMPMLSNPKEMFTYLQEISEKYN